MAKTTTPKEVTETTEAEAPQVFTFAAGKNLQVNTPAGIAQFVEGAFETTDSALADFLRQCAEVTEAE